MHKKCTILTCDEKCWVGNYCHKHYNNNKCKLCENQIYCANLCYNHYISLI